jgi:amino acid adenylation domain-containing protein
MIEHEQTPLSVVRDCSGLSGDTPLFISLLNYRHSVSREISIDNSVEDDNGLESIGGAYERTNYPLCLSVDDDGEHFRLALQCINTVSLDRMVGYVITTLNELLHFCSEKPAENSDLRCLNIIDASERSELLVDFNQTLVDYPSTSLMHELFESQVASNPSATALVFGDESLSYSELDARSNQLAHYLIAQGVSADSLVGLCVERSFDMVIGIYGILKAGGAYVPIDPQYPESRIEYILSDASLERVLTHRSVLLNQPCLSSVAVCLDAAETASSISACPSSHVVLSDELLPSHLAYVIYTSGSTGQPKGVMVEHQALVNRIDWMQSEYQLDVHDRVLQKTPYTFDVSVWEFTWPLMAGAQLVIAKPDGHKDPAYLLDTIARQGVSTLHFVPSMLRLLLEEDHWEASFASVNHIFCSGEALPADIALKVLGHTDVNLHNLYGPTEAAIDVTYWPCDAALITDTVLIGRAIQNISLYVVDRDLQPVPLGVEGELLIGGVGLARGYLNKPELTAKSFIDNPFDESEGSRVYRTGDLVCYRADGTLDYRGRIDSQVKLRGFRIELGEIENQARSHESIQDAVVILDRPSEADARLIAYVVGEGAEADI